MCGSQTSVLLSSASVIALPSGKTNKPFHACVATILDSSLHSPQTMVQIQREEHNRQTPGDVKHCVETHGLCCAMQALSYLNHSKNGQMHDQVNMPSCQQETMQTHRLQQLCSTSATVGLDMAPACPCSLALLHSLWSNLQVQHCQGQDLYVPFYRSSC